jgi:hypothetical protein
VPRRYRVRLPCLGNDGSPIPEAAVAQAREELLARFGRLWSEEGPDGAFSLVADVEDTAENREFFANWEFTLRRRFRGFDVEIVSFAIDVI